MPHVLWRATINANMAKQRIQSILDELDEALDYEETNDVAKARRVVTLTKKLLVRRPSSAAHSSSSVSFSPAELRMLKDEARIWLNANDSTSRGGSRTRFMNPSRCFRG